MGNAVYGKASMGGATVTTSATRLGTPLGNRTNIVIYNNDAALQLFIGVGDNAQNVVAAANGASTSGYVVEPKTSLSLDFGPQIPIYGIVASGSIDIRFIEAY